MFSQSARANGRGSAEANEPLLGSREDLADDEDNVVFSLDDDSEDDGSNDASAIPPAANKQNVRFHETVQVFAPMRSLVASREAGVYVTDVQYFLGMLKGA